MSQNHWLSKPKIEMIIVHNVFIFFFTFRMLMKKSIGNIG